MAAKPSLKNTKIVDKQTATESVFQVQADEPSTQQPPELQVSHGTHRIFVFRNTRNIKNKLLGKNIYTHSNSPIK